LTCLPGNDSGDGGSSLCEKALGFGGAGWSEWVGEGAVVVPVLVGKSWPGAWRADEHGEAASRAAGAFIEIVGELDERAGLVLVLPQGLLQGGDQGSSVSFLLGCAVVERRGVDQSEPASDLAAARPGEHTAFLDLEAGVGERRR
jgi:hypothetical protein